MKENLSEREATKASSCEARKLDAFQDTPTKQTVSGQNHKKVFYFGTEYSTPNEYGMAMALLDHWKLRTHLFSYLFVIVPRRDFGIRNCGRICRWCFCHWRRRLFRHVTSLLSCLLFQNRRTTKSYESISMGRVTS